MSKDPAFLLYSKDFYEGTRMMLPEERACYMDLMIYQHQNGNIPSDLRRILMYCSGIDEATLKATLKAKFKQDEDGSWFNEKLNDVIQSRIEYSSKQSINGSIGQFWKKAKAELSIKELRDLKDFAYQDFGKENLIILIKKHKTLEGSLKALLKHLENAIEIENEIENKDVIEIRKGGVGEKQKTEFSLEIENCYADCLELFPEQLHPAKPEKWKEVIDKLNRIDKIPFEKITEITKMAREDVFWSKNFLSLTKLREKQSSSGLKYIVVFNEKFKPKQINSNNQKILENVQKNLQGWG